MTCYHCTEHILCVRTLLFISIIYLMALHTLRTYTNVYISPITNVAIPDTTHHRISLWWRIDKHTIRPIHTYVMTVATASKYCVRLTIVPTQWDEYMLGLHMWAASNHSSFGTTKSVLLPFKCSLSSKTAIVYLVDPSQPWAYPSVLQLSSMFVLMESCSCFVKRLSLWIIKNI